jgi:two-component system phosphate regulon sensor histidine kinase PhoR
MKKIFPIITVLVFISALGIVFFQIVWIKQALQDRELQFEETVKMATATAGKDLIEEKGKMSPFDDRKNADLLFPLNIFPSTIAHKFSREEIRARIKKAFEKN